MQDIRCRRCGEPWEHYTVYHELSDWDDQPDDAKEQFLSGKGCPTCNWGEKAGEVSTSRHKSDAELEADNLRDLMNNTDEDPLKYI